MTGHVAHPQLADASGRRGMLAGVMESGAIRRGDVISICDST